MLPREVLSGQDHGHWTALAPWEVWRCGAKGGVEVVKPRSWTALAPQEVWRSVQSQGTADCRSDSVGQTDMDSDRQKVRHTESQINRMSDRDSQTDSLSVRHKVRQTESRTDRK